MTNSKKILAIVLSAAMVVGSSLTAFAADATEGTSGTSTGEGGVEGIVDLEVFHVTVPTASDTATLAYFADPQGLIQKTAQSKPAYANKNFGPGTLFFTNASGDYNYSNKSDAITFVNKSSFKVDVDVKAKATVGTGADDINIELGTKSDFDGEDTKGVYLALTDDLETPTTKAITATDTADTDAKVKVVLAAAPEEAYEYSYDTESSKYKYDLVDGVNASAFATYNVYVTGAANPKATWLDGTKSVVVPEIGLTWAVAKTSDQTTTANVAAGTVTPASTAIASGATEAAENSDGVTHDATLSSAADTVIRLTLAAEDSIEHVYVAGSIAGLGNNKEDTSKAEASGNTVTIKKTSEWATANVESTKYIKIVTGTETFVIRIAVSDNS